MMRDVDKNSEKTGSIFIYGNFWHGLDDDELFKYSYPSRFSMAQKKLSVAEAGYLSRLLAEKLYECTVSVNDCGTSDGIEISYSPEKERLMIDGEILPTLGDLNRDAERVFWGRVIAGETRCLDSDGVKRVLESLKKGGKVKLRSPLHCHEGKNGHVCAMCYGADIASKPYDSPEPVREGFAAGLTAAEAIGERGTQLAMKRFHDVGSNSSNPIQDVRKILAGKKQSSLSEIITEILTLKDSEEKDTAEKIKYPENYTANKELPQSLIHFETAAAYSADIEESKYISDIAGEKIVRFLVRKPGEDFNFSDSLRTIKSRLLWEGGEKNNADDFHE
jgi:DNA-directed RNA polymerase beta' subunit